MSPKLIQKDASDCCDRDTSVRDRNKPLYFLPTSNVVCVYSSTEGTVF